MPRSSEAVLILCVTFLWSAVHFFAGCLMFAMWLFIWGFSRLCPCVSKVIHAELWLRLHFEKLQKSENSLYLRYGRVAPVNCHLVRPSQIRFAILPVCHGMCSTMPRWALAKHFAKSSEILLKPSSDAHVCEPWQSTSKFNTAKVDSSFTACDLSWRLES